MSRSSRIVGHEELSRFIRAVLEATGACAADAAIVAEGLVWANLRDVDGHGVSRLPSYLKMIKRSAIDVEARPQLVQDRAATFLLDGGRGFGPVAMMQAIAIATERARALGVCFGLVLETTHTGAIGRYAQWAAERGCAALIMVAGPAFVAYHGARVASMGTSPIAIAVPSGAVRSCSNMATSIISNGKILQAIAAGAELPPGTVLTAEGEPTNDPRRAEILLPLGGPKGSGLALMFEMLASVLAAAPIQAIALGPEKRRRLTQNCVIFAIDIATFRPLADFRRDADALAAILKALSRQAGVGEILLPGERAPPAPRPRAARPASRFRTSFGRSLRRSPGPMRSSFRRRYPSPRSEQSRRSGDKATSANMAAKTRPKLRSEPIFGSAKRP